MSRFFARLSHEATAVQGLLAELTERLREQLPEFGKNIAVDSSTVRTHSNPDRKPVVDSDASWTAKGYKVGYSQKQWHFGYKLHAAVDAESEMVIACYVTPANKADSTNIVPLLEQARDRFEWFKPETVIADKGYDSQANSKAIIEEFQAAPIIALRNMRRGAKNRRKGSEQRIRGIIPRWTEEWKLLYAKRTSVERYFGRIKENRRLERHCYRGMAKIQAHCLLSVLTAQAKAVVQIEAGNDLRQCLRKVA